MGGLAHHDTQTFVAEPLTVIQRDKKLAVMNTSCNVVIWCMRIQFKVKTLEDHTIRTTQHTKGALCFYTTTRYSEAQKIVWLCDKTIKFTGAHSIHTSSGTNEYVLLKL